MRAWTRFHVTGWLLGVAILAGGLICFRAVARAFLLVLYLSCGGSGTGLRTNCWVSRWCVSLGSVVLERGLSLHCADSAFESRGKRFRICCSNV